MTLNTLLDVLRSKSQVDCDTLDVKVAEALGPLVDCTSNQAIAFNELQNPEHESLIRELIALARRMRDTQKIQISVAELATEIMMVKLSMKLVPYLTGYVHTQTNPYHSFSTEKTILNAQRIIDIYHTLDPEFDTSRVCIKIPSIWEGLQACQALKHLGIATLATTLFSMEQAAVAADAGCAYIALDSSRFQEQMCSNANNNQVLPASLTSITEVMKLSGVHHITLSPPLLAELANTDARLLSTVQGGPVAFFDEEENVPDNTSYDTIINNEAAYRIAYAPSKAGANEAKLTQAINIFCDMQDGLQKPSSEIRKARLRCCEGNENCLSVLREQGRELLRRADNALH